MNREAEAMTGQGRAWRQTAVITMVAAAAFFTIRNLPLSGGTLHYTDFHAGGKSFLEFCEPGSPQFAPVDRVRSPVSLELLPEQPPEAGVPVRAKIRLTTSAGKPVTVDDLLVVHTEKLHLLLVDASLDDYHHVHPAPTAVPGEYVFEFTPLRAGRYRAFADFTPRATGRGLYAGAGITVAGRSGVALEAPAVETREWGETVRDNLVFRLSHEPRRVRANELAQLELGIARRGGGPPVQLEEIMGARAHLVAFDAACSGFAHLHPSETVRRPDEGAPHLGFTLLLSDPGYYRIWAQVKIDGREIFAPFGLSVGP